MKIYTVRAGPTTWLVKAKSRSAALKRVLVEFEFEVDVAQQDELVEAVKAGTPILDWQATADE